MSGMIFGKAHFRGPEHIRSMVDLIKHTPSIDGLDISVFREINGKKFDLSLIGKIIDGQIPFLFLMFFFFSGYKSKSVSLR